MEKKNSVAYSGEWLNKGSFDLHSGEERDSKAKAALSSYPSN